MVEINKEQLFAYLRQKCIDVEKMCNEAKIDRMSFYSYCAHRQMPKTMYEKLTKTLQKEFRV